MNSQLIAYDLEMLAQNGGPESSVQECKMYWELYKHGYTNVTQVGVYLLFSEEPIPEGLDVNNCQDYGYDWVSLEDVEWLGDLI